MAEGFELYHVPQQSRRDKLRVSSPATPHHNNNSFHHFHQQQQHLHQHQHHSGGGGGGGGGLVVPFYDPSIHLDLLTCATNNGFQHPQSSHLLAPSENPSVIIKGEGPGFMGFLGNPQSQNQNQNQTNHNSSSPTLINTNDPQFFYHAQAREFGPSSSSSSSLYRPEPLVSRQGLSLSLSSHNTHLPMEVNFQYSAPPGPFTGYTSVLKCSIFLRPAQQLLQEICDASGFCSAEKMEPDLSLLDPPCFDNYPGFDDPGFSDGGDGVGAQAKSRLISMLDEVYRKYKQYYQQLQAVVASFESIPGLNNAAPFASFALKALSKHFKCLKASITDQLRFISKAPGSLAGRKHGHEDFGESDKFVVYNPRPVQSTRIMDNQPVWRPQRGLPERAVSVLRAWLFEHFLHPYPTDTDKIMLAKQTGLSRSQVSNWFINARVRLWKPMVEEIHALETRQQGHQHKGATAASSHTAEAFQIGQQTNNNKDHHYLQIASASSQTPDHARTNPSSSNFKSLQDIPPEKRVRNELAELPLAVHHHGGPQQLNMDYGPFGVGSYSNPHQGGDNGVSLTLALHQNNHGINGLLDPFPPLALAHRYGLPGDGDGCMVGNVGFEPQNRHFSSRDVMGGQLLHDFVKF